MTSRNTIDAFRTDGAAWPSATRAGQLIFAGSHTPHDLSTGRLVMSTADLAPEHQSIRAAVLFT